MKSYNPQSKAIVSYVTVSHHQLAAVPKTVINLWALVSTAFWLCHQVFATLIPSDVEQDDGPI